LGIDKETLRALVEELSSVTPERVRAIIEFAVQVSHDPQGLVAEDYARVREQGVTDEELVEIILIAATANCIDTLADALKIEVEPMVTAALGR
jgi:alkylhydroperoxidase family enzyme